MCRGRGRSRRAATPLSAIFSGFAEPGSCQSFLKNRWASAAGAGNVYMASGHDMYQVDFVIGR